MNRTKSMGRKVILALALTLVMAFGLAAPVFAANGPITVGENGEPAEIAITKYFEMPLGTDIPDGITFTYDVAPVDIDKDASDIAAQMPAAWTKTVSFTDGMEYSKWDLTQNGDTKILYQEVNVFAGVAWKRAGVHHFVVTEKQAFTNYTANAQETISFDTQAYDIYAYVDNVDDELIVTEIVARTGNPGTPGEPGKPGTPGTAATPGTPAGEKIDAKPGTPGKDGTPPTEGKPGELPTSPTAISEMEFTNTYWKNNGGGTDDPIDGSVLDISKVVTGRYANQSFYFDYDLTVTKPAVVPVGQTYKAYIVNAEDEVVTNALNGVTVVGSGDEAHFVVTSGTTMDVKLKHDERIAFVDLHVGATYTITESAKEGWTPKVSVVANGGTAVVSSEAKGEALTVAATQIGENANSAAYSNEWDSPTPTGLDVNDLPFIMMLVLAAGALAAFVVVRYRKKAHAGNR